MAIVPRKTENEVTASGLPSMFVTPNASREAFGGLTAEAYASVGKAVSDLGLTAGTIAVKMQISDNEREAKMLQNDLMRGVNELNVTGSEDRAAFYETRGLDTVNSTVIYKDDLKAMRRSLMDKATNSRVREVFGIASDALLIKEFKTMDQHTTQQRIVANDTVDEAHLKELADDVTAHPFDIQKMGRAMVIVGSLMTDRADRNGWDEDVRISKTQEAISNLMFNALSAAIQQQPSVAKKMYDGLPGKDNGYKKYIDGALRPEVEKLLEEANLREDSQREADAIMSQPGLSNKQRRDLALSIDDPKVRDETLKRVAQRLAWKEADDEAYKENVRTSAYEFMYSAAPGEATVDNLAKQNPEIWRMVLRDNSLMQNLIQIETLRAKQQNHPTVSDPAARTEVATMSRGELAKVDPVRYQHLLSEAHYGEFLRSIAGAKASVDPANKHAELYSSALKYLTLNAPPSLQVGLTTQTAEQHTEYMKQVHAINSWLTSEIGAGHTPSSDEINRKAYELMAPLNKQRDSVLSASEIRAVMTQGKNVLKDTAPKNVEFGTTGASNSDRRVAALAQSEMDKWNEMYVRSGRSPSRALAHQRAMELWAKVTVPGATLGIFSGSMYVAEVEDARIKGEDLKDAYISMDNIPGHLLQRIRETLTPEYQNELSGRGIDVNDRLIERLAFALASGDITLRRELLGIK